MGSHGDAEQAIRTALTHPLFERELSGGCRLIGCQVATNHGSGRARMCLVVGPEGDVRTVGSWWRLADYYEDAAVRNGTAAVRHKGRVSQ